MNLKFIRWNPYVGKLSVSSGLRSYSYCIILASSWSATQLLAGTSTLSIAREWALPMIEISGLSIGGDSLCAISDNQHEMLRLSFDPSHAEEINASRSESLKLDTDVPANEQAQWEAVSANEGAGLFVLKESENRIFQFDSTGRQLKTYNLQPWHGRNNPDRGYEGLLLLQNGHFLVALETDSAALIEYGPAGDAPVGFSMENRTLVPYNETFTPANEADLAPLAAWTLKDGAGDCKLSDLAQAEDGGILVLEKGCMRIAHVSRLNAAKTTFAPDQYWSLPLDIEHPEGLQALPDGKFLVSSDIKTKVSNLYLLNSPK